MTEPGRKQCTLWVHEDHLSNADVIFNSGVFPKGAIRDGDLVELVALRPAFAGSEASDREQPSKGDRATRTTDLGDEDEPAVRDATLRPESPDRIRPYLFLAKSIDAEQRTKQPNLQVCHLSGNAHSGSVRAQESDEGHGIDEQVDKEANAASHVEFAFKDEFLARSDLWRMIMDKLSHKTVYKGQKVIFMGSIKVQVKQVYRRETKVYSAYFAPDTKAIFRSESARQVFLLQMSKEMWDFDSDGSGDIMFNKLIDGFLPQLFSRWARSRARHLISIVLFTRVLYNQRPELETLPNLGDHSSKGHQIPHRDFYRVVVSEMDSIQWTTILHQLKREFRVFRRDISSAQPSRDVNPPVPGHAESDPATPLDVAIPGTPSASLRGNVLEAMCLAYTQFAMDHIDRDLMRTGSSIVVVTPGTGYFEVEYDILKLTTEILTGNGFCIDMVCLSRMPLHSVPLFKYRNPSARNNESVESHVPPASSDAHSRTDDSQFGSPTTQYSNPSPSRVMDYETHFRKPHSSAPDGGQWIYAMPTWIDVSYWAGASELSVRQLEGDANYRQTGPKRVDGFGFLPRVNMYELQMMGIMEDEMSNVSLSHLNQGPPFRRHPKPGSAKKGTAHQDPGERKGPMGSDHPANADGLQRQEAESSSAFAKLGQDRPNPKEYKESYRWMDEHDDQVFCSMSHLQLSLQRHPRKLLGNKVRAWEDDARLYGTSFNGKAMSVTKLSPTTGTAYLDRKMRARLKAAPRPPHPEGNTNPLKLQLSTPTRPPYQLGGGGVGRHTIPLKALASTELKTEHAIYGPIMTGIRSHNPSLEAVHANPATGSPKTPPSHFAPPRNSDGDSESKESSQSLLGDGNMPSRPIAIKIPTSTLERSSPRPVKLAAEHIFADQLRKGSTKINALKAAAIVKQAGPRFDPAPYAPRPLPTLPQASELALWLTPLNPSQPSENEPNPKYQLGRWQHVIPHPSKASNVKWKSLCSPAINPLTTEWIPTAEQLASEYNESPYTISIDEDEDLSGMPQTESDLLKELIAQRLARGFQFVIGSSALEALGHRSSQPVDVFDNSKIIEEGAMVVMSLGNNIHQLQCAGGGEVEIKRYVRKPTANLAASSPDRKAVHVYPLQVRTSLAERYESRELILRSRQDDYNWNYVDSFIAGYTESFTEQLRFWCARFVLVPVDQPDAARQASSLMSSEDNEEETRLEGIRKLTQLWQRYRYVPPEERRFQGKAQLARSLNPLDIVYQTRDPSAVVAAELDNMDLMEAEPSHKRANLFAEEGTFRREKLNLSVLAQEIQSEKGVPMQDRRWHWRLHHHCFIGFEMTSWLLQNFRDVHSREEAVDLGNELMRNGLFQHVQRRHQFRDGNFFYQIGTEYRTTRPDSRRSWFGSRKLEKSAPSTPASDVSRESPLTDRVRSDLQSDRTPPDSESPNLAMSGTKRLKVVLSKVMQYDVDPRKRSYRPELINLHYERIHNPDNCYHLRIDWMNVTAKLIEDAIATWAATADKYGLRLVQVPIREASVISEIYPLQSPYTIPLAVSPPLRKASYSPDVEPAGSRTKPDGLFYHRAILQRFGFVLDTEAATNFPADVEVTYSWGKPEYRYTQFIHRSGVLLAQITDDGDFLLADNRLYQRRSASHAERFEKANARDRLSQQHYSPMTSPLVRATLESTGPGPSPTGSPVRPEEVKDALEQFCRAHDQLQKFYDATPSEMTSPAAGLSTLDSSIPSLGLPPSLFGHDFNSSSPSGPESSIAHRPTRRNTSHASLAGIISGDER
ncbi:MAG: vacuolar membrane-associated protein iml1 [Phylliscum demangeonii]|nr:MAG: vacuolar membrane-associated protein iml1 [Phylliscum demangeonii]